ncbi:MAG TPA: hypothetical protein VGD08_07635 [Stellaceae bacterium]|jgi:hypothetical protein
MTFPLLSRRALLMLAPAAGAAVALAGCDRPVSRPIFGDLRFTDRPPIRLDVAAIDVVHNFKPSFHEPFVEHLFPVPPERAAENWAHDRLQAAGTTGRARVTIADASVREVPLKRTEGLRSAFTKDQTERYDATLEIGLDILNDRGFPVRTASARASHSRSVAEGITPNEREQVWYELTRELISQIDQEMERQIRATFGTYLV